MRSRPLLLVGLAILLLAMCVAYGAMPADPGARRYPGNEALATDAIDAGDRVVLSGTVRSVADDRVVVDLKGTGTTVTLRRLGGDPAPGDDVWGYGVVRAGGAVTVHRAVVRAPWELTYLYAVSLLGGLLTLGRVVRTWRFDRERRRVVPREGRDG